MQFVLFIASTLLDLFMLAYLPETSQPRSRGIDKLLESEGSLEGEDDAGGSSKQRRRRWVWLNPFQSVAMFRSPNLLAVVSERFGDVSLLFHPSRYSCFLCVTTWCDAQCLGGTTALMTDYGKFDCPAPLSLSSYVSVY